MSRGCQTYMYVPQDLIYLGKIGMNHVVHSVSGSLKYRWAAYVHTEVQCVSRSCPSSSEIARDGPERSEFLIWACIEFKQMGNSTFSCLIVSILHVCMIGRSCLPYDVSSFPKRWLVLIVSDRKTSAWMRKMDSGDPLSKST